MPARYAFLCLFLDEKTRAIKRKRRAKESPKIAVMVANLNIRKNNQRKNARASALLIKFLKDRPRTNTAENDNSTEYLICDIKIEASLMVPESFFVGRISILTKYTKIVLTKTPIKKVVMTVFHSLLEKLVQEPIIMGSRRSGNFILSTLSPIVVSFETGSQRSSTKKRTEKIMGRYFWSFIFFHFIWNFDSKSQFIESPIKERLIGTLPRLILAARQEIKKTYTFLYVVFFSN